MEKGNFEKEPNSEQLLENFQQEIEDLRDKEAEKKKLVDNPDLVGNPDLLNIEVDKLTEDDMKMWRICNELTAENITQKNIQDFEKYRKSTHINLKFGRNSFVQFLANKFHVLWMENQIKNFEK